MVQRAHWVALETETANPLKSDLCRARREQANFTVELPQIQGENLSHRCVFLSSKKGDERC